MKYELQEEIEVENYVKEGIQKEYRIITKTDPHLSIDRGITANGKGERTGLAFRVEWGLKAKDPMNGDLIIDVVRIFEGVYGYTDQMALISVAMHILKDTSKSFSSFLNKEHGIKYKIEEAHLIEQLNYATTRLTDDKNIL